MAWLASDLIADVRRRAMLPNTVALGLQDADLLSIADNEMASRLVPLVTSVNEEFYVVTYDVPLVAGKAAYRIPNRSAGGKLRDVSLVTGSAVTNLPRIEPEQLTRFVNGASGVPAAFFMEAGTVNIIPTPGAGGSLRMRFYVRPGRLTTTTTDVGTIASIASNTSSYPGGPGTFSGTFSGSVTTATSFDVIAFRPPFEYLALDASQFTFSAPNIVLIADGQTSVISGNLAVGDYICKVDKSPIMQLPVEMHSLLAQRVVCSVMEQLNYRERWELAEQTYEKMEVAALKLLTPRVDGAPRKMRGILDTMGRWGGGLR